MATQLSSFLDTGDRLEFFQTAGAAMQFILRPWQIMMLITLVRWVNRRQQDFIERRRTENTVLKEHPMRASDRISGAVSNVDGLPRPRQSFIFSA